jgi:hypothetical protein
MSMLTERLQVLIRPDQRGRLEVEAKRRRTSVGALVGEAVDAAYGAITPEERVAALEAIRSMHGRFLAPDELNRLVEQEREQALDSMLNGRP